MKKFFSYVLTFVLLFVMAAAGTIFLSTSDGDQGSVVVNTNVESAQETSFFSGLLSTFDENKQYNIQGNIKIACGEEELPFYLYANLDIADDKNIKAEGFINTQIKDTAVSVSFKFYNGVIYINVRDVHLKMSLADISTLKENISTIAGLIGLEGEDLVDLAPSFNFDVNKAMVALNNVVEEKLANGNTRNIIRIEDLLTAYIILNENSDIDSVKIETEEIMGFKISADLSFVANSEILITNPENKTGVYYLNVLDVLDMVKNLVSLENFNLNFSVDFKTSNIDFSMCADILADINAGEFMFDIENISID